MMKSTVLESDDNHVTYVFGEHNGNVRMIWGY
jgi:hypothetical protein